MDPSRFELRALQVNIDFGITQHILSHGYNTTVESK